MPSAPTTTVSGSNVVISWAAPNNNGSPIVGYVIQIRQSDGVTFSVDITSCDGSKSTIREATSCSVPITTLRASTYQLPWGSSIYAQLYAYNIYGNSLMSSVGNGAIILTIPDSPLSAAELYSSRTATSIGLQWSIGVANGGAPVIDY